MKLVIELDKIAYDLLTGKIETANIDLFSTLIQAVQNGTPLPKGHGRLIDADEIQFENIEFDNYGDYCRAFDTIDQADTIIEADKAESENNE